MKLDLLQCEVQAGCRLFNKFNGIYYPWYTIPFIENLLTWEISSWKVFEYGSGDSTFWWRKMCKKVISVDTDKNWAEKSKSFFVNHKNDFINYPFNFIDDEKFDCIVIDSDPVEWRDECVPIAIDCIKKNGILIIDNYKQTSINLSSWPNVEKLLHDKTYQVFTQTDSDKYKIANDWSTAYWVI